MFPDLEMLGLALEGAALVARAEVDEGMRCLDEATATALAGDATIPISSAWTCCMLVTACIDVLDYERASEWCDRIAEFADRYGSRYMLGFCRAKYGDVHLWRGRWEEAEALLEASAADLGRSRPANATGPLTELAELRRRQRRTKEAAELLEQAGASAAAQLCQARIALDAGDPLTALELLERLRRQGQGPGQASGLELLVRARAAEGRLEQAREVLGELRELERMIGTTPLRASADLADGVLAAAAGEHERARALLEDAVDAYERSGAPTRPRTRGSSSPRPSRRSAEPTRATAETCHRGGAPLRAARRAAGGFHAAGDATRAGRARTPRRRIDEPPDRRTARSQRAHGPPARGEHPAEARRALAAAAAAHAVRAGL